MIGIVLWILFFMLLVVLHEFGHFLAAKKSGVKVKEFWIGIPPKICTFWKDKSGTEYTLNWIPLGGFVSLKWDDTEQTIESKDKDSFQKAKLWKKVIIILAGVTMNLLIAFVIFTGIFMAGIKPISILPETVHGVHPESYLTPSISFLEKEGLLSGGAKDGPVVVQEVLSGSAAELAGISSGSVITHINGREVSTYTLVSILQKYAGIKWNQITFENRVGESQTSTFDCAESCTLGIAFQNYWNIEVLPIKYPLWKAMLAALKEIKWERNMTMSALGSIGSKLFSFNANSSKEALNQLTGPVGAIKFWERIFSQFWILIFLWFGAMLSLALAFFNVLPIPALDGGRLLAILIQAIFRIKQENFSKVEGRINVVFFWLLMLMGIVIIFKDLIVWRGVSLPFFK